MVAQGLKVVGRSGLKDHGQVGWKRAKKERGGENTKIWGWGKDFFFF